MMFGKLLNPAVWLMRRMRFAGKLTLLAALSAVPLLAVAWQFVVGIDPVVGLAGVLWASSIGLVLLAYFFLAFHSSVAQDLGQVMRATEKMLGGDLRLGLLERSQDELGSLAVAMEKLSSTLSGMVANVRSNAAFVAHSGKSLAAGNRDLSDRTEQQAANLEQTAASVEQLSSTVQVNANTASQTNAQAARVRDAADNGAATMAQAIEAVEAIQGSAKRMDEIVGVIDGLAFQTNILALNAAVEAARAGESGRGFAVVAAEVRSLAQRSADSAKEIRLLIATSASQVAGSVQKIRAAGTNMTKIVSGIRDVATNMSQLSTSSAEQSSGLTEITSAVRQLDEITQRNALMVGRAVTQAVNLEGRARTLVQSVASFKLQQGSAEEAVELVERAMAHRQNTTKTTYLRGLTDPAKGFYDRDMYVFVLDRNGSYVAFGGNPSKVGTRVQDIAGIDGGQLLKSIIDQASHEPGWVEYDITNPSTGRVQTKMSFVQQVDDLFVGCGVYKNLAVA
ncbi:MAG: methyl-accepting chemotaxis protein [Polaromonas sp.]|uniref:methyl-accepting chemotaxis protein n=1 Tax=Polaromonas sp. TaxID=1869339 RepID=UPI00272F48CD|nr:methyl-accepting chemotaxis protein [Polaromonas sp.]MDP2256569.1 methyl-accepting chemotaxis protein [Polaromonas sp.]MDP3708745.1 methyl-accepting chemotaxis protein [Polaromonas sp.]